MTFYDGNKKVHHWFPRVQRMSDDYTDYSDTRTLCLWMTGMTCLISAISRRRTTIPGNISIKRTGLRRFMTRLIFIF